MSFVIGLTGGIGSGKTTVAKLFAGFGIDIIDTDEIAHKLTASGGAAISSIRKQFGDDFITVDGALNRNKMRQLIFATNDSRQKLENILHPLILAEVTYCVTQANSSYVLVVVPLLFETDDYYKIIKRILVVDCDEQLQITRTIIRSKLEKQEVKAIMAVQISRQDRLQKADDVILNNKDMACLQKQVSKLHHDYLALSLLC